MRCVECREAAVAAATRVGALVVACALALVMLMVPVMVVGAASPDLLATARRSMAVLERQRYAMGVMFSVVVRHPSRETASVAADKALDEIVRLDRVLSHYDQASELSRLNRDGAGEYVAVDVSLYDVIAQALEFSRLSSGRFDITVGPLVRLWRQAHEEGRPPTAAELNQATDCVGYQQIETRAPNGIRLRSACMALDLGGIGKGYAVDRAIDVLKNHGVTDAVVNAGGSTIAAIGTSVGASAGAEGWPIRVRDDADTLAPIELHDMALSTSRQALALNASGVGAFGEIIDPSVRAPASSRVSVRVVARTATDADALSTALLLSPIDEGRAMLDQIAGASAMWLSDAGHVEAIHGPWPSGVPTDGTRP